MTVTVSLTFSWPMGHRILDLPGDGAKCTNVHGHNWTAVVELPNDDGALEFGEVKAKLGDWIDQTLDHGFMVHDQDPFMHYLVAEGLKHYVVPKPPTTEVLARVISQQAEALTGVRPFRVHVQEGPRNAATWYDA